MTSAGLVGAARCSASAQRTEPDGQEIRFILQRRVRLHLRQWPQHHLRSTTAGNQMGGQRRPFLPPFPPPLLLLQLSQMLVHRGAPHRQHVGDVVRGAFGLERPLMIEIADQPSFLFAAQRAECGVSRRSQSCRKVLIFSCQSSLNSACGCGCSRVTDRNMSSALRASSNIAVLRLMHNR